MQESLKLADKTYSQSTHSIVIVARVFLRASFRVRPMTVLITKKHHACRDAARTLDFSDARMLSSSFELSL
jgi:hypothetical protein